jgi:hypothetical protein
VWFKALLLLDKPANKERAVLVALLTGSWRSACRMWVPPGSVAVDLWTDPDDNRSDNDGNAVTEGDDELEDAGCDEDCKDEDAGGDGGSIEDDDDGFGYNDDDSQDQDGAEEARAVRAAAEPRCGGGWVSPRCGACGAERVSLETHFMIGGMRDELPCTGACATREAWLRRRDELCDLEGLSRRINDFEPFSLEALLR